MILRGQGVVRASAIRLKRAMVSRLTSRLVGLVVLAPLACGACSGSPPPPAESTSSKGAVKVSTTTKIPAFSVSNENLNVDSIGMRDGALKPDGSRDHVFTATIDGPVEALFLVEVNQKGDPIYGFRADTMVGGQDLPRELGGVVDTGKMTIGVGVVENNKFVNEDNGSVVLGDGHHVLKLYAPNTNLLAAGDFVRLYVRSPDGGIVASPVSAY
jgi:hypothetical protein